jgi:hypothetical protein
VLPFLASRARAEGAGPKVSDVAKAIDVLERQPCACLPETGRVKVVCLRCELLGLLGADSALISRRPNRQRKGNE